MAIESQGSTIEQISLKLHLTPPSSASVSLIQEELRSTILKLGMLPKIPSPPELSWKIMIITRPSQTPTEEQLLTNSLTSGDWFVDNNQLPESLTLARRSQSGHPKLLPIKTFRTVNNHMNLSVYIHQFQP